MELASKVKLLLVFLLVVSSPCFAVPESISVFKFKGLNNNSNSVTLDPAQAQDLLNVDITPGGTSIKKRPGYGLYKALGTGQPVKGGAHFYDSSGNDVQVWGSSTSLYGIVSGGTPIQLTSTATLNSTWDCADTQGYAYCVNSSHDIYLQTNGSTASGFSSPLGSMVEATPDRIVVAGVPGAPNSLYFSQSNVFTNFTIGINPTDAFVEPIASPGSKLTHIRYACGKLLWWKDASFGYFDFDDQFNASNKIVSDSIGTFDNTSAVDPGGNVWFRGQDGHTWKYDCSFLTKQSIDITPDVTAVSSRILNSWSQSSAADFTSGNLSNIDTNTVVGSIQLPHINEPFNDLSHWTVAYGNWSVSSGQTEVSTFQSAGTISYAQLNGPSLSGANNSLSFDMKSTFQVVCNTNGCPKITFGLNNSSGQIDGVSPIIRPEKGSNFFIDLGVQFANTGIPVDTSSHNLELQRSNSGALSVFFDGVSVPIGLTASNYPINSSIIAATPVGIVPAGMRAIVLDYSFSYSSGTYYSPVHNSSNFNAWGTLSINSQSDGGSQTFYLRSSTNSFSVLSSTPAWTTQTAGNLITISTGTYFQFRDEFIANSSSANVALNDVTLNWFEGLATDQAYMQYFDNAIWESVAFGGGQSTNNYIFKRDLLNDAWLLYGFGAGGMLLQNNVLYFGDPLSGNIYNFGTGASDNGTAINAYWRSKTFTGQDPFLQNALNQVDIFAKKDQGSTLTATYTTDTSSATAVSVSLSGTNAVVQNRKLLPSGKLGYTWDMKVGDTSASSQWELLGFRVNFSPQPYRPTQ